MMASLFSGTSVWAEWNSYASLSMAWPPVTSPRAWERTVKNQGPTSLKPFALTTSEVIGSLPLSSINFDSSPLFNAEQSGKPLQFSEPQSNGG